MKWEEYIPKLNNLEQDFEEGLLKELHEEPPYNLHNEIIKSITKEKHRFNILNYKIYVPAMAALLIFTVMINRPEIMEKLKFQKNINVSESTPLDRAGTNISEANIPNTIVAKEPVDNSNNVAITATSPETAKAPDASISKPASNNTATQKNSSLAASATTDKNTSEKSDLTTEGEKYSELNIDNIIAMNVFKEPTPNYEIILGNPNTSALSFITENYDEKLFNPNTYRLSTEQYKNLTKLLGESDISKKVTDSTDDPMSKVVKLYFVNYSISLNNSQPNIINYLQNGDKLTRLSNDLYKISKTNMKELDKLLQEANIQKNVIYDEDNGFIILKLRITNYETSITSNNDAILSFLRDTTRCNLIDNNLYKMSRDNFAQLKELLITSGIEYKILNETYSKEILIRININ